MPRSRMANSRDRGGRSRPVHRSSASRAGAGAGACAPARVRARAGRGSRWAVDGTSPAPGPGVPDATPELGRHICVHDGPLLRRAREPGPWIRLRKPGAGHESDFRTCHHRPRRPPAPTTTRPGPTTRRPRPQVTPRRWRRARSAPPPRMETELRRLSRAAPPAATTARTSAGDGAGRRPASSAVSGAGPGAGGADSGTYAACRHFVMM